MILVTGASGYIGSHTCVELLNAGRQIVGLDNLSNSSLDAVEAVKKLTRKEFPFYVADLLDEESLDKVFAENKIDSVIHFAGLKAVGESVAKPVWYYKNNISGTVNLLETMQRHGVKKIVFSSSATVYGAPDEVPIREDAPTRTTNPYGSTKLYIEGILRDLCVADAEFSVALLRYFNPIGAHKSGILGENPNGIPNNLMPRLCQAVKGQMKELTVFGTDYPTVDGTGVRDYIHVCDIARGHLHALKKIEKDFGVFVYNLGTGKGYSVFELINTFSRINKVEVPYVICPRRPGDVASVFADPSKAKRELDWEAELGLDDMCADSWNFIKDK